MRRFVFFIFVVIDPFGGLDLLFSTLKIIVWFADVRCCVSDPAVLSDSW
jgi:hypothetical protein